MRQARTTESKERREATHKSAASELGRELYSPSPGVLHHGVAATVRSHFAGLQRAIGNQAVLRLLSRSVPALQKRLTINQPGDQYEQEADRVAEQVMRMPDPVAAPSLPASPQKGASLQRKCAECEEEEKLHRKEAGLDASEPAVAPPIVHEVLSSPGQPLDTATRDFFEPRFGYDFSQVHIHSDSRAAESARSVNALAYTVGQDIVFDRDRYAPHTDEGRQLLGHEFTHVIQQSGNGSPSGAPDLLQRQSPQNPNPPVTQTLAWGPDNISIQVENRSAGCVSLSQASGLVTAGPISGPGVANVPYSGNCPKPCAHQPLPLQFAFKTDLWIPRPGVKQGDKVSALSVFVQFTPSSGGPARTLVQGTDDGIYDRPGDPLKTSLRTDLSNFTLPPGSLIVSLINSDRGGGQGVATYTDQIDVIDCPGVRAPGISVPMPVIQLHTIIVVPDPEHAPLIYYLAGPSSQGPFYEVQKDEKGYFYVYKGKRVYLPEDPTNPPVVPPRIGPILQRKCAACELGYTNPKLQRAKVSDNSGKPQPRFAAPQITTSPGSFVARQPDPNVPTPTPTGGTWANCPAKEMANLDNELTEGISWVQKGIEDLEKKDLPATTRGALGRYLTTDPVTIVNVILPYLRVALVELKKGGANFQCRSQADCVKMNPDAPDAAALASFPITLCSKYFDQGSLDRASDLIHECLHHAGLRSDIYEFTWPFPGLSDNERLRNEDSYVAFVRSNSIPMLPPSEIAAVQVGGGAVFPGGGGAPRYVVSAEYDLTLRQRVFRFLDLKLGERVDVDSSGTVLPSLSVGARAFAPVSVSKVPLFIDLRTGVVAGLGGPSKDPNAVLTTLGIPAEVRAGFRAGHFGASLDYRHVFNFMKNNPDLDEVVLSGELRF